ncbi:MAG: heavy metal translocating P-type ATPase [Brevinemataceae bacterium]
MKQSIIFQAEGMHCTTCALRLEKKLMHTPGINHCSVNFSSNSAFVEFNTSYISEEKIINISNSIGITLHRDTSKDFFQTVKLSTIIEVLSAWIFTLLLTIGMIFPHIPFVHEPLVRVIISGLAIFGSGLRILNSARNSLNTGIWGMDILIALGALSAWISACLGLVGLSIPDYSMTAAMLIAVNITGRLLEDIVRRKAARAISSLANFGAKTAFKVIDDSEIVEVPISELHIGDIIQIKAGEKIPADGTIIQGRTSIDESFLTGESLPIEKQEGDFVFGASLNIDGFIKVKVEKESQNTLIAQTIRLVQQVQETKIPIQVLADNITSIFVPIILIIALLSFSIWLAFPNAIPNMLDWFGISIQTSTRISDAISAGISVLVIACPCALGLATPMALLNGSALGAKRGILIRKGAVVQILNNIPVIALDKTGTLTIGKPKITSIIHDNDVDEQKVMPILNGLESHSAHPLAFAIMNYAAENNIQSQLFDSSQSIPGQGIFGVLNNTEWFAGSLKATEELGINISSYLSMHIAESKQKGETLVCLSDLTHKECKSVITFSDQLKPEAVKVIKLLKNMKKKIIMVTGDHYNAAKNIADKLEITSIFANCSPQQKLETIKSLQSQEHKVCFVGDGINDAAALEAADAGIAIGSGSDIAADAGDIVLISDSLMALVSAFRLANSTFVKIKQNLFWAFFYNAFAIPIAFLGLMHPVVAEIAMTLSSLTVIANSMILLHKKI